MKPKNVDDSLRIPVPLHPIPITASSTNHSTGGDPNPQYPGHEPVSQPHPDLTIRASMRDPRRYRCVETCKTKTTSRSGCAERATGLARLILAPSPHIRSAFLAQSCNRSHKLSQAERERAWSGAALGEEKRDGVVKT
jgi:hypothetical protein